jgi:hypothetical protein
MTFVKTAAVAAAMSMLLGATGALAQSSAEPATSIGCLHMAKKVSAALDANQQSPNYSAARTQAQGAQSFCTQGLYKNGVAGYAKALEMLGAA